MSFDLAAYLERIGLDRPAADAEGLRALQQAHMRAVPFENFDPLLGKVPLLGIPELFAKIVQRRRGGYCFEQNGLYGAALAAIGFAPRRVLARVRMRYGVDASRSHLVLRADVGGRSFLTDVGFGGPGPLIPLEIGVEGEQVAPNGVFRLVEDPERGETVVERLDGENWLALYAFDYARVTDAEIAAANFACAAWGEMPFGSMLMFTCFDGPTRYGVFNRSLTIDGPEGAEAREFRDFAEFEHLVRDIAGIALERAALEQAWEKISAAT